MPVVASARCPHGCRVGWGRPGAGGVRVAEGEVSAPAPLSVRFAIAPLPAAFSDTVETLCITLAPDGSQLAFVASDAGGVRHVWLPSVERGDARVCPAEGARA